MYSSHGDYRKATAFYQQGLTIAKEVGDKETEERAYGKLGGAYASLYDFPKAIEFYQKNVSIAKEIGNKKSEEMGYNWLGCVYCDDLGDFCKN